MRVFLSYSHADKGIATRLRRRLEQKGISFSDPAQGQGGEGTSWRELVERAIRSSDAVLLLLSSRQRADEPQQLTWRLALEAVWTDSTKSLIPILLQDAELPAFVRSGASGDNIQAIRIRDLKDIDPAVPAILRTLGLEPPDEARGKNGTKGRGWGWLWGGMENHPAVTDEDRAQRRERLSAIRQYAEQLKH